MRRSRWLGLRDDEACLGQDSDGDNNRFVPKEEAGQQPPRDANRNRHEWLGRAREKQGAKQRGKKKEKKVGREAAGRRARGLND